MKALFISAKNSLGTTPVRFTDNGRWIDPVKVLGRQLPEVDYRDPDSLGGGILQVARVQGVQVYEDDAYPNGDLTCENASVIELFEDGRTVISGREPTYQERELDIPHFIDLAKDALAHLDAPEYDVEIDPSDGYEYHIREEGKWYLTKSRYWTMTP
jgi:hypothetical protein